MILARTPIKRGYQMNRNTVTVALALAAMGLSACDDHEGPMVNAKLCPDFTAANGQTGATPIAATDAASPVDECVRRWAFSLAGAPDRADVVAKAAVAACGAALTKWSQAGLNQQAEDSGAGSSGALSLTTGEPTNPIAEHTAFANGRALLYVVQARAGRCAPPPVTNGVPTGT